MEEFAAPGILAYRGGDCFANLVSLMSEMPAGRDINSSTLEGVLQEYVLDFAYPSMFEFAKFDLGTKSCHDILRQHLCTVILSSSKPAAFLGVLGMVYL